MRGNSFPADIANASPGQQSGELRQVQHARNAQSVTRVGNEARSAPRGSVDLQREFGSLASQLAFYNRRRPSCTRDAASASGDVAGSLPRRSA
jgi:hypothetical protein